MDRRNANGPDFLTLPKAARRLGVGKKTLAAARARDELPTYQIGLRWQVVYFVPGFWMRDPLNGNWWYVYADITVLQHGPGAGGVSGNITWRYWH